MPIPCHAIPCYDVSERWRDMESRLFGIKKKKKKKKREKQ